MHEQPPSNFEQEVEKIPTPEEVQSVFEQLVGEGKYETQRQVEDEHGLYLWSIVIMNEEEYGYTEYEYARKGQYEKGEDHGPIQAGDTAIHVTFYDKIEGTEDYMPAGGRSVAKCIDGEWILSS